MRPPLEVHHHQPQRLPVSQPARNFQERVEVWRRLPIERHKPAARPQPVLLSGRSVEVERAVYLAASLRL